MITVNLLDRGLSRNLFYYRVLRHRAGRPGVKTPRRSAHPCIDAATLGVVAIMAKRSALGGSFMASATWCRDPMAVG
jgi:hypothetical protein